MNQECAIGSRSMLSSTNSPRRGARLSLLLFLVISVLPLIGSAATDGSDTRYDSLGHRVMCICDAEPAAMGPKGCRQVLLECTHNNCEASRRMRRELSAALQKGDTDDMVLDSFVKEYGTSVLVAPPAIDKLVWLVALIAIIVVVSFVGTFMRKRRSVSRPERETTS